LICDIIIFPVVYINVELGLSHLREECRFSVFEKKMLRKISRSRRMRKIVS
jgi:hypothetical protein